MTNAADSPAFFSWLCDSLRGRFEADPEVLARYVVTLLRTDDVGSDAELHAMCEEQLEEFLGDRTKAFVAEAIARLRRGDDPERIEHRKEERRTEKRGRGLDLRDTLRSSRVERSPDRRKKRREMAFTTLRLRNVPAKHNHPTSLFRHFKRFGTVVKIQCIEGKSIAFVQMKNRDHARKALDAPDAVLGDRFIQIEWAQRDILTPEEVDAWEKEREQQRTDKVQEDKKALLEKISRRKKELEKQQEEQRKQYLARKKKEQERQQGDRTKFKQEAHKRTFHLDHRPRVFCVVGAPEKVQDAKILKNHFAGLAGFISCTMADGGKLPATVEYATRRTAEAAFVQGNKIGAFPLQLKWSQPIKEEVDQSAKVANDSTEAKPSMEESQPLSTTALV